MKHSFLEIICVSGDLFIFFGITIEDLLNKRIGHTTVSSDLFIDCIEPLLRDCIQSKVVYQFDFSFKNKKFSCSIYPCMVLKKLLSIDIVIRNSQNIIINNAIIREEDFL